MTDLIAKLEAAESGSRYNGANGRAIGTANREAIRAYFLAHVGCTNTECAAALGASVCMVGRHIATLRAEWLTADPRALDAKS